MPYVNTISNIIILVSVSIFIVFVFGRDNSAMNRLPFFERYAIKLGLTILACGGLFNVFRYSEPHISDVVMNIGFAIVFSWGAIFHYKYFVKKDDTNKK
jgi:hypothetical protein